MAINWTNLYHLIEDVPDNLDRKAKKNPISAETRNLLKKEGKNDCKVCGKIGLYGTKENGVMELMIHHIIPNGDSSKENLIFLCYHCHQLVHSLLYLSGKWRYVSVKRFCAFG